MEIRIMTENDVDEVAELDKKCFAIPWSRRSFADETKNSLATYFVAVDNGKIAGYCGYWSIADEGDITNIAVLPQYRRMGVASELLNALIKSTIEKNIIKLNLEVRKSNAPAKALYEKFGFFVIGERKRYYSDNNEDALIMTKIIE